MAKLLCGGPDSTFGIDPVSDGRLLIFVTDLKRGGTPTVVRELALRLRQRGHEVEVACLDGLGEVGAELRAAGVEVFPLEARGQWDWGVARRFVKLVRERRYTHVYSLLMHANAVSALASRIVARSGGTCAGVKWFQSVQTTQAYPWWHWMVQRVAQAAARRVIVPGVSVGEAARMRAGVPEERLVVIPNAVDVEALSTVVRETSASGRFRVGFVGRMDPIKRLPDLFAAMRVLGRTYELHVWGDGADRLRVEQEAAALRAAGGDVTLHGTVAGPAVAFRQCDVIVLPSQAEGMPLVVIEAMAAGVPVVGSNAPGIRDVIEEGVSGWLYPTGDVVALADRVRRVKDGRDEMARIVERASAEAREKYGWEHVLGAYEQALEL